MQRAPAGLQNGAKIAVIGGGVSGGAMAAALLFTARTRARNLHVHVYEGGDDDPVGAPVVLSPECRSRLAALGCRVPLAWRGVELSGIELFRGSIAERLDCPPGGLWVVDGWPERASGQRILATALSSVSALQGAIYFSRSVDRVEEEPQSPERPVTTPPLIVRARGKADRYHAVIDATGEGSNLGGAFFDGYSPAPTLPAAHARVTLGSLGQLASSLRIVLAPVPGVDALYLVPCRGGIYALAYGPSCSPADLCQALMGCARDGQLPDGFEIAALAPTRLASGVGRRIIADGRLAVGPAALGHPFQLTASAALASCSRAAVALVESGTSAASLELRYLREGIPELCADAAACARANRWLRRAGLGAVGAFTRGARDDRRKTPWHGGLFGLSGPTARGLLERARAGALTEWLRSLWARRAPALPVPTLPLERPVFYVVDDDPDVREALSEYLETRGAEVVCFSDELALYCAVARRPPSAIILDVVLQWVDGLSLCEGLKRHPLTRQTPVVVMSGINRPFVRNRALEHGAVAFFGKPVDPELLWRRLMGAPQPLARPAGDEARVESGRYAS